MQEEFDYESVNKSLYNSSSYTENDNSKKPKLAATPEVVDNYDNVIDDFTSKVNLNDNETNLARAKYSSAETQAIIKEKIIPLCDISTNDSSDHQTENNIFFQDKDNEFYCFKDFEDIIEEEIKRLEAQKQKEREEKYCESLKIAHTVFNIPKQSIYKNKYKEVLEYAKSAFDDVYYNRLENTFNNALYEKEKTNERWVQDGEGLSTLIHKLEDEEILIGQVEEVLLKAKSEEKTTKALEKKLVKIKAAIRKLNGKKVFGTKANIKHKNQISQKKVTEELLKKELRYLEEIARTRKQRIQANEKKLENMKRKILPLRTRIMDALESKRLVPFCHLYQLMDQIKDYVQNGDSVIFFENFKGKRSMKYFMEYMDDTELFYWTILVRIVLILLPKEEGTLSSLSFGKTTTPFLVWLLTPNMTIQNKTLFKEFYVRDHLRTEFEGLFNVFLTKAKELTRVGKWRMEKLKDLVDIVNCLDETNYIDWTLFKEGLQNNSLNSSKRRYCELDEGFSDYEEEIRKFIK